MSIYIFDWKNYTYNNIHGVYMIKPAELAFRTESLIGGVIY